METTENVLKTLEEAHLLSPGSYSWEPIEQEWALRGYDLAKTRRKTKPKDKDEPLFWDWARRNR